VSPPRGFPVGNPRADGKNGKESSVGGDCMEGDFESELEFRVIDESGMDEKLDRAVRDALVVCFSKDGAHFSRQRWWHSRHHWTVAAIEPGGRVAGGLCVVERGIMVGGRSLRAAGVGNVCARPEWRGKGIIDRVMTTALEEAAARGFEVGLLFCLPPLEKVYARMGWRKLDARVVMEDESGARVPIPGKNIAMGIPILLDGFPGGDIDLMGRDW